MTASIASGSTPLARLAGTLLLAAAALLGGCATRSQDSDRTPIVFVHGNGDSAALWQTTVWRFESNGWPTSRLQAIDIPYPLARDEDLRPQPGRTSTAEQMAFLKAEVDAVLERTGAPNVILVGNSRGGTTVRNYIQNGGGNATTSHAILAGAPNHGIWAVRGMRENSEFSGIGPFLTSLNAPKNPQGDEVVPPVRWLTIRSDNNDKYAQPDGVWIGSRGVPTNVSYAGPELRGATNAVLPGVDHRETAFSPAAFETMYRFITGEAPRTTEIEPGDKLVLNGTILGLGLRSEDPASGNFVNNLPLPGARLEVFAVDPRTGERLGDAVHEATVEANGRWGPFDATRGVPYEFVVTAPGYPTNHIYRSPFPRSSYLIHLQMQRRGAGDEDARAIVTMTRPRGYFDVRRDKMSFGGLSPPPGLPPTGAGISMSKLKSTDDQVHSVVAEFNGERVVGRTWPAAENHLVFLELTY
jgi:pimeloyl-ACP methyl ester carboxylesterase